MWDGKAPLVEEGGGCGDEGCAEVAGWRSFVAGGAWRGVVGGGD